MQQPPHYIDPKFPHHVCKLNKAIYGIKQSPRQWYLKLHIFLISHGYTRLQSDLTIYTRHTSTIFLVLAVYVDDLSIMCNSEDALIVAKNELANAFPLTDGGPISYCLGLLVQRDYKQGTISLSQARFASEILQRFNMASCKGVPIPLAPSVKLSYIMPAKVKT